MAPLLNEEALQSGAVSAPCVLSQVPGRDTADSTDILIVVHQAHSTPGRIGERLERRGYRLDVRRPALGDPLPDALSSYAGAVVFGGPMSVNDDLPFIRAEIDFIDRALKAQTPLLGICLGGQMMAKALGARVSPHREGTCEIGYYPLAATDTGAALLPWPSHVYHWHSEGFELPRGADLLATGEVFPNQAFRYGASAYALQFHPEVTREMMCLWTVRGAHNLTKRGAQPGEAHLQGWGRYDAAVCRWLDGFLDMWLAAERGPGRQDG
ncbi:GMP synthase (glutamine-hydrolyzing) [Xanthobacter agilis]|uniref:GMP synthase (Glutamine-hydrolyzing) n=1 Tax=Xanthobacter agilis TaxID=47492 RepID=A0ABU0L8I6_XANAG|nr:GMP synthase (glutamine-hydrolyzing) [Xanthobacter agilis]